MLSKKNLVFQKNQTIATLNVHFSSTQSPGCLSIQRILFRGEDNSGLGGGFFALEQPLGWGLSPWPLGSSWDGACLVPLWGWPPAS